MREVPAAESPAKKPTAALMFFTAGLASSLPLSLLLFPFIKMKGVFRSLQSRRRDSVCVCAGGLECFRSSPPLSPSPSPAGAQTVYQVRPSLRDQDGNTAWDFTVVGANTPLNLNGVRGNGKGGEREEVGSGATGCSGAHLSCPERPGCLPELGSLFQPREGGCWALRVYLIPPSPALLWEGPVGGLAGLPFPLLSFVFTLSFLLHPLESLP